MKLKTERERETDRERAIHVHDGKQGLISSVDFMRCMIIFAERRQFDDHHNIDVYEYVCSARVYEWFHHLDLRKLLLKGAT